MKRILGVAALVVASVLASAALSEILARAVLPRPRYFALWQWDPVLGHAPVPSTSMRIDWWVSESLPVTHYQTNSWGFRDREFHEGRTDGVGRVLVVGDSFSEAVEVEADERFSAVLERRLTRPDRPVEVWNMGVGDYGTAQEYLLLREYVRRVSPDVVVLQVFPLNDVVNNGRDFAGNNESQGDDVRPYFVVDDDRLIRADPRPVRSFLRRHSLLFADAELAAWWWAGVRVRQAASTRTDEVRRRHRAAGELDVLEYRVLSEDPDRADWAHAWRVTGALLRAVRDLVAEAHATLVVALVPCREEYLPSALAKLGRDAEAQTGAPLRLAGDVPTRRLCGELASLGVPCVPLREGFAAAWGESGPRHERHGHYDPEGHRLIGEALAPVVDAALRTGVTRPATP